MQLPSLSPVLAEVGWGALGTNGQLGYEGKPVVVRGKSYQFSLSSHPPARLQFNAARAFKAFRTCVALNDDVPAGRSYADFFVYADGRQVGSAPHVVAGEAPRLLQADISGAQTIELVVRTTRWDYCHAVWLDPELLETPPGQASAPLLDCLARAEIGATSLPSAKNCIATVVSPNYERQLENLLGSLRANAQLDDSLVVVFAIDPNAACEQVSARYGAAMVPCRRRAPLNPMSKALLYSVGHVIDAERFLLLDADMLVVGDLNPIFAALEVCAEGSVLACREGNDIGLTTLDHALGRVYVGGAEDRAYLGISAEEAAYPLVVNDGLFAASRGALMALDGCIRAMPNAIAWADSNPRCWWRNQFIFNFALARLRCGVELDAAYNLQLHFQDPQLNIQGARVDATWRGRGVRVLHFNGEARRRYPEIQSLYAAAGQPWNGTAPSGLYAQFLETLRTWAGRYGSAALSSSFNGTSNGHSTHGTEYLTSLLSTLHNLIGTNGCVRVLETGTAMGVSAACLASSVAHRTGGCVVTMDPHDREERKALWETLPTALRSCIEERRIGSIEGMAAAVDSGEIYHAALLDSSHTEEQVWAEFQFATQLVRKGGLILVRNGHSGDGGVAAALDRIAAAGYGVVRLRTASEGVADDHLGLAVIENRPRAT